MSEREPRNYIPWWPFLVTTSLLVVLALAVLIRPLFSGSASSPVQPPASSSAAGGTAASVPAGQGGLAIHADTVLGGTVPPDVACTLQSRYARSSHVVFRADVLNAGNGQELSDSQVSSVVVKLDSGQQFNMKYGPHPATNPTTHFWSAGWTIPDNYPTGAVHYTITAVGANGQTAQWQPLNVSSSLLTVIAGSPTSSAGSGTQPSVTSQAVPSSAGPAGATSAARTSTPSGT